MKVKIVLIGLNCMMMGASNWALAVQPAVEPAGKMGLVRGNVTVDQKPAKLGAPLYPGNKVEAKEGQATLLFGKGTVVHLASNSTMIVTNYQIAPGGDEVGDLDLKFGKTRALILNQGNQKKDIKIRARAATMGVRGTEVMITVPVSPVEPVQMFTVEGKAEVQVPGTAAPQVVAQNQGVVTSGAASTGANTGSGPGAGGSSSSNASSSSGSSNGPATVQLVQVSSEALQAQVAESGLAAAPTQGFQDSGSSAKSALPSATAIGTGFFGDTLGNGSLPPPVAFDPVSEGVRTLGVVPRFCPASESGPCF